jgi:hypothetical protein
MQRACSAFSKKDAQQNALPQSGQVAAQTCEFIPGSFPDNTVSR